jgi:hypothetical protein
MPDSNPSTVASLRETQGAVQDQLMSLRNVVGVGIANKVSKGRDTGELALAVFVTQKEDPPRKEDVVPSTVQAFKTDVVETGPIFASIELMQQVQPSVELREQPVNVGVQVLSSRVRPVMGGYSVGHYRITAGTYATAVTDAASFPGIPQRFYVLSNNHVLANSNDANIGDPILQPGPYDGGVVGQDTIARLARYVPINFAGQPNYVDCAIAEGNFDTLDREIYWIGYAKGAVAPAVGMVVQKTGRTTNYSTGRITAINATVNVNYGGGKVARFERQILTTSMSAGGDSGSLVLEYDTNRAVGLLFAGSATVTILNDIRYVQQQLGIRIS